MHRRAIFGLALATMFAVSGRMALADEHVIVARYHPAPGREAELEARLLRSLKYVKQAEPNASYAPSRLGEGAHGVAILRDLSLASGARSTSHRDGAPGWLSPTKRRIDDRCNLATLNIVNCVFSSGHKQ